MSLESWKAEFYPVPAADASGSDAEAIEHSLRKWRGLEPEALARHGVERRGRYIQDAEECLLIGDTSCALCRRHDVMDGTCPRCPIKLARGRRCDRADALEVRSGTDSPWVEWAGNGNPYAMQSALHKAAVWLKLKKEQP